MALFGPDGPHRRCPLLGAKRISFVLAVLVLMTLALTLVDFEDVAALRLPPRLVLG